MVELYKSIQRLIRRNLVSGLLALTPIGVVLWIIVWLWQLFSGIVSLFPEEFSPRNLLSQSQFGTTILGNPIFSKLFDFITTFLTVLVILLVICIVGIISRNYLGNKLLKTVSRFVSKVPVLSTVYSTLEQLLKTFSSGQAKNFRRVVYVEYPRKGIYTLALVTGERATHPASGNKEALLNIYVPTTPNPTSGFYLTVLESEVTPANMSVEQALKEIISMGIVGNS
ncbi:MAG: DUF502 domain-containing protein [Bacteriovoracia bacterium]